MAITIRRLSIEDHALLCAVAPGLFDNPVDPAQATAFLEDPGHHILLAFDGDQAVGMASGAVLLHPDKRPTFFINEVGTRDGWLRQGVATALCDAIMALARDIGCHGIWLGTEADNTAALALYRKLRGAEVPGVYFGWDDAL